MFPFISDEEYQMFVEGVRRRIVNSCPKCSGKGYLPTDTFDQETMAMTPKLCECAKRWNFTLAQISGGIPQEFWKVEDVQLANNSKCSDVIDQYCHNLPNALKHGLGFLFTGENGCGKTTMATLVLAKAIRAGYSVFYITTHDMLEIIYKSFKDDRLAKQLEDKLSKDFIVLDELDKVHMKEGASYALSRLDSILRKRRAAVQPTIVITNLTQTELHEHLGESIMSIMSSSMKVLRFAPGDHRKIQGDNWSNLLEGQSND